MTGTNTGSFDPEKTKTESATSNLESMQGNINSGSGTQSKGAEIGSSIPTSTSAPAEEKPAVTEVRVEEPASPPQSTAPVAQDSSALPSGGPVKTSAPQSTDNAQFAALPESTSLEEKSDSQKEAHDSSENELDQQVQALRAANPNLRTVFKVKYVAEGVAYLDGGRADGLSEGMKLEIKDNEIAPRLGEVADPSDPRVVAELEVNGVAEMSAVTDIHSPKRRVTPGDLAYLSTTDLQTLVQQHALSTTRKYPAVVTFTEGDPLEEEARAEVPKPPLPSVNRARGRIGLDYIGTSSAGVTSSSLGVVLRADITRLNGTYWNISGYWRGRLQSTAPSGQQTIQDLINRTYHLSMTYDNPGSNWVAGFGRLYLPWAPSLETIDGGYFGRRFSSGVTGGIFAGSTPDPTSYSYNPDQEIAGAFINFDGGSYDDWKYTSTSGVGVSALHFAVDRPFVFFENGIFYKRYLSIYDSLQADSPKGNQAVAAPGPGLSRNFLTVRIQPHPRVELDFNHNYFRDVPTFDPTLIGTGLLDKYLFQGFSAGTRVQVFRQIFAYTELGSSNRTGDAKSSLNQTYGITFNRLPWFGIRADAHYSRFNSSFGDGSYKAVTFSRNMSENLRLEVLLGQQDFVSGIATSGRSRFVNANIESTLGSHYFVQGGFGMNRGDLNYTQWMFTLGYRFDNRSKHE